MAIPSREELRGLASLTNLPEITLKGNSYERGLQYGKAMRHELDKFYYWFVQAEPKDVMTEEYVQLLEYMEELAAECFPQLLDQAKGWADGSKIGHDKCRLLVLHNEVRRTLRPGCSNVVATKGPQGPWMARNCDLFENERSWQVMKRCYCDDCHSYAGVHYLGLPVSMGVNSAGLAIGGSSMPARSPKSRQGFPNLPMYMFLTHSTVEQCVETLERVGHLGLGHLCMLDAKGDAIAAELGSGKCHIRRPDERGVLVVTNHSPSGKITPPDGFSEQYIENSHCRYDRLAEIMEKTPPEQWTTEFAWGALADREEKWPVCEKVPEGFHTIHSFVVRPAAEKSETQFCWGYPGEAEIETWQG